MTLFPDQSLPSVDRPADEHNASQSWQDLISQMFPATNQFTPPVKPVTSPENRSNSHLPVSSAQYLEDFATEFDTALPDGNALSDSSVIYDDRLETSIPRVTDLPPSSQHDLQSQVWSTRLQSSIPKNARDKNMELPTPNFKSQDLNSSNQDMQSTDSVSQMATPRTNDAWMNDIWMNDADLNKFSSIRTVLEMDIGLDDVFAPNLSASALDANSWGQWWDTGA